MPSITPVMSDTLREDASMEPMVCTTCSTTAPPLRATSEADCARALAWRALSAFCFTLEVISSIEAAVCSSALAWDSVRADRSWLPAAICCEALAMCSVPLRTFCTMRCRLSCMACMSRIRLEWSPARVATATDRLPSEMLRAMLRA